MKTLIIARHGNTFGPGDTPTRVGARTDLPLVEKGREQARALGLYLKAQTLVPETVYASPLLRTQETAQLALEACGAKVSVQTLEFLREIDYGPDENQTEEAVVARIGLEAIRRWNEEAVVPSGWLANPENIKDCWLSLAQDIEKTDKNIILVVTSNGIARFAPVLTGDFESFRRNHSLKLRTGAIGIFLFDGQSRKVSAWDVRP
ncbi:MAG: histidine phosphatase family protein [Alphaproteobacteria bacterium]|nr:histidine phosphatase family protein [Alphaproteobacteria bacterium]